jgi:hypothetical protein
MGSNTEQKPNYAWHEAAPGIFRRSMAPLELFFNPLMEWSVWTSIKLGPISDCNNENDFIDRVRQAWIQILFEQPQIASTFDFAEGLCTYKATTDKSSKLWLEETFLIAANPYKARGTRAKPSLIINPTTQEIVYRAPHYYTDGIGVILLLSDLVAYIAKPKIIPEFGNESKNLAPTLDVATNVTHSSSDLEEGARLTNGFLLGRPSIEVPFKDTPATQHSVTSVQLTIADSNTLVSACRSHGLTVTHAVHSALMQTVAALDPDTASEVEKKFYTSIHVYNWRNRIQPQYQRCHVGLYCGALPMAIVSPSTRSFTDILNQMKDLYQKTNADQDMSKVHSPWWAKLVDIVTASAAPTPTSTPLLSSLGVVENYLPNVVEGVEVKDFGFGIDTLGPVVTVYAWNWKGKVNLSAAYDDGAFGDGGVVKALLKGIVERLGTGLGVELSANTE